MEFRNGDDAAMGLSDTLEAETAPPKDRAGDKTPDKASNKAMTMDRKGA